MTFKEKVIKYLEDFIDDKFCDYATERDLRDFILPHIKSMQEEPVSEDFEAEWKEYFKYRGDVATVNIKDLARHFANWQKKQDQETIELAEDHAMLAGMEKMKEQMMKDAVECDITGHSEGWLYFGPVSECDYDFTKGDKVKLIIIKEE